MVDQRSDISDIEVILQPSLYFSVFLKILIIVVVVGAAEVHLLDGMRPDRQKVLASLVLSMMRFLDIRGVMLPFPIVKLLSRRHEFPLHADLVVLPGTAALIELYFHHFGESTAILVGRRGRVLGLREGV